MTNAHVKTAILSAAIFSITLLPNLAGAQVALGVWTTQANSRRQPSDDRSTVIPNGISPNWKSGIQFQTPDPKIKLPLKVESAPVNKGVGPIRNWGQQPESAIGNNGIPPTQGWDARPPSTIEQHQLGVRRHSAHRYDLSLCIYIEERPGIGIGIDQNGAGIGMADSIGQGKYGVGQCNTGNRTLEFRTHNGVQAQFGRGIDQGTGPRETPGKTKGIGIGRSYKGVGIGDAQQKAGNFGQGSIP